MADELKPCPFCGAKYIKPDAGFTGMFLMCQRCYTQSKQCQDVAAATVAWNTRTQPTLSDALGLPEIKAMVEAARALRTDLYDLIAQSGGVYGLHLNGDNAPWDELLDGGQFGDWLRSVGWLDAALAALQEKE